MNRLSVHKAERAAVAAAPRLPLLQRKCECGGDKPTGTCTSCGKARAGHSETAAGDRASIEIPAGSSRSLDPHVRGEMEAGFGRSFADVRIHDNSVSHAAADQVNARAFTVGQNVHFGAGEYAPGSAAGKRLLAHELTHTIQQQSVSGGVQRFAVEGSATDTGHLEAEADRAADMVLSGQRAQVSGNARSTAPQLQPKGPAQQPAPAKAVEPVEPDATQKAAIDEARRAAAVRTQVAMFKASGIQGSAQYAEARNLAKIKFDWENPNMEQIAEVLSGMGGGLISVDVKIGGKGDPDCGSRAGYVRAHHPPIVLCPGFFSDPTGAEGRTRTMIHEMAHIKGIGNADAGEQYFVTFDCTSKGAFESADSWANYVHCLSGQTPDKPMQVTAPPGGTAPGGGGKAPGGEK